MNRSSNLYFQNDPNIGGIAAVALRGGGIVFISQTLGMLVRMVSSIVLARILTPPDFGLVSMVTAITGMLFIFKDFGLCDAVIQSASITQEKISTLFWVNLAVSAAIGLALVAVSPLIALFYREPRLTGISVVWSLLIVVGGASAQHQALLKRRMFFFWVSVNTAVAAVVGNGVSILMAWRGAGYWSLVAREIVYEASICTGAWFLCTWRPSLPSRHSGIRVLVAFGRNSTLSFIVRRLIRNLDRTLIGWRYGAQPVGFYNTAFEWAALPASQISDSVRNVAVSALSKVRDRPAMFRQYYLKAIRIMSLFGFAATGFLVISGKDLIFLILGPQWGETGRLFCILGLGVGPSILYMTHVWLHFSLGRADRLMRWSFIEAAVIVTALAIGLPFGAGGVAWAYTLAINAITIWGLWYGGSPIGLRIPEIAGALCRPMAAAAAAAILSWSFVIHFMFNLGPLCRILVSGFCLVLVYLALIVVLFRSSKLITEFVSTLREALLRSWSVMPRGMAGLERETPS
jgi:O-antigen/teichoic acid export membrane protein